MLIPTAIAALAVLGLAVALPENAPAQALKYPKTPKVNQVDDYHGTKVADPYRWLEDANSKETGEWVTEQNEVTEAYLNKLPMRDRIRARLTNLWNYPKYEPPHREGEHYFFQKNDGLQNQSVLYVQKSLKAEPRVLLDPNYLSKDGTIALSGYSPSHNGKLLAYYLSDGGSDWHDIVLRDMETGADLSDHLTNIKFSGASWTLDNKGFLYSRFPKPDTKKKLQAENRDQKIYYHTIGTDQSADQLVYERPDIPEWGLNASVTEDGRYAVIYLRHGTD